MKWYKVQPQINRELQDTWEGYLSVISNWCQSRWNEYALKRPAREMYL